MTEQPNDNQTRPRSFFTLLVTLNMKWLMIAFPAVLFVVVFMPMISPNALSSTPEWVLPVVAVVVPLALGLISASWIWWRGGTVSAVAETPSSGTMWWSSAVLNRWLYLIILPVFIIVIILLGTFAPGVLTAIPPRLVYLAPLAVVVLFLALRFVDGIRRLR